MVKVALMGGRAIAPEKECGAQETLCADAGRMDPARPGRGLEPSVVNQ
jgi:hypothetical protein